MDKNVCIVTWYKSENYGTCLQAMALYQAIKNLNCNPYMLEYGHYYTIKDINRIFRKLNKKLREYFREKKHPAIHNLDKSASIKLFCEKEFNFLNISSAKQIKKTLNQCHCFIVGSDQLWNPDHFDETYLLDFVPNSYVKASYATSIGVEKIPLKLKRKYVKYLKDFRKISLREEKGAEIIGNLLKKNVSVMVDPTFLLSYDDWITIANKAHKEKIPDHFILCYFIGGNMSYWKYVHDIQNDYKLPIINIPMNNLKPDFDCLEYAKAGPYEFVWLLNSADLILTDSFHACALSLNLQKRFMAFHRFPINSPSTINQNNRLDSLFCKFDIKNAYYDVEHKISSYDVNKCNGKINELKQQGLNYLKEIIQ